MVSRFEMGWWKALSDKEIGLTNWSCLVGNIQGKGRALICEHNKTHTQIIMLDDGTVEKNGTLGQGMVCPPIGACKLMSSIQR